MDKKSFNLHLTEFSKNRLSCHDPKNNTTTHPTKFVVALSGGVDSVVLLHYLATHFATEFVRAVHVNHRFSPHAHEWQVFCEQYATALGIDFTVLHVNIPTEHNIEATARELRYEALYAQLHSEEMLVTAHHQHDQAETVLLHACRGSTALGLSAMTEYADRLWRPFLHTTKSWIRQYAVKHELQHIEDESNANTYFRRNFMRHTIIPALEEKYPSVVESLAKVASHQQTARRLLDDLAKLDIKQYQIMSEQRLLCNALIKLSKERALNVIYWYLREQNIPLPHSGIGEQLYASLFAKADATPHITWSKVHWRIFQAQVYVETHDTPIRECEWYDALKDIAGFNITYRTKGQRIRFAHKAHSEELTEVMRVHQIPQWKRDTTRLYHINEELVAIEYIGVVNQEYFAQLTTNNA